MYFKEYIELGVTTPTTTNHETTNEVIFDFVFANKLSVFSKEYYDAKMIGLKPELAFEIRTHDYVGQTRLKIDDKNYYLIRTSENQKNDTIEMFFSSSVEAKHEYESV